MNKLNNQKGISLIVLVITIIVMIVLAAAIILSLQSSGIIGRANEAKAKSDVANKKQAATVALSEYELAKQLGEIPANTSATDYVIDKLESQGIDASDIGIDENSNIIIGSGGSAIQKGVQLGDYVSYTPAEAKSTKYKMYDESQMKETTEFVTETSLKWRYMGVDEKGNALLVADSPTTGMLLLSGGDGYLQGPSKLNDLCKELYSSKLGEARSIDVEDVNRVLEANPVGRYYSASQGAYVENINNLTIGELGEVQATITSTPDGVNTWEKLSTFVPNMYNYIGTDYKAEGTKEHSLIFKKIVTDDSGNTSEENISYFLASNLVSYYTNGAAFCIRHISSAGWLSAEIVYDDGAPYPSCYWVRPVIVLNSNVQFGTKTSDVWIIN